MGRGITIAGTREGAVSSGMLNRRLVLGSTAPHRAELLERLRIPFETAAPLFDEIEAPAEPLTADAARALALTNARGKARSLAQVFPDALILAADQVAECDGVALGKPRTVARAVEQLLLLAGREHRLWNGLSLLDASNLREEQATVCCTLRVRALSRAEVVRYVALEEPLHSAGSYLSEGLGIALFDEILTPDPTAVVGLPLLAVAALLRRFGVDPLQGGAD